MIEEPATLIEACSANKLRLGPFSELRPLEANHNHHDPSDSEMIAFPEFLLLNRVTNN
jgi:hypothetical protein